MPFRCSKLMLLLASWLAFGSGPAAWGKIQFDVFPGYDTMARAGAWYPVAVEVFNDGPTFNAVVELSAGQFGGQVVRVPVELPTNTRKRFVVPLFSASQNFLAVDGRLLDDRGKVRDERLGQRVSILGWEVPLLGALPATFAGAPSLPEVTQRQPAWQPRVARMQPELVPDNPIALEGLNSLYLNTARALELKEPQVRALLAWVYGGGQLIVAVDQPGDVNSTPWLRNLLPADLGGLTQERLGAALQNWVMHGDWNPHFAYRTIDPREANVPASVRAKRPRDDSDPFAMLAPEAALDLLDVPLVELRLRDGVAAVAANGKPLVVSAGRGRGQVVLLAANPEREPLKSWKLRPWFFARLADVPSLLLRSSDVNWYGGRGLDGVFGAMIETRQIRKLPVGFLLLLLVVYLVVIGPLDQWWLRKINRPMLTWITFPIYVVLFSLLIYFIGYKLRAGQTEWNELQVVDVLPQGDGSQAALRGWTFGSLYSPANETYRLTSALEYATLRGEFKGLWGGPADQARVTVTARAQGFDADVFVPVWTSTLDVSDWEATGDAPLVARRTGPTSLEVRNASGRKLAPVWVVAGNQVVVLAELGAGASRDVEFSGGSGRSLPELLSRWEGEFQAALGQRDDTFGGSGRQHIDDWPNAAFAASFPSSLKLNSGSGRDYVWPAGFDLTPLLQRGDPLVLAWMPDATLTPGLNRFAALRTRKAALLRLAVPPGP